ncbi:MAG: hypothetical protein WAV73_05795 [Candidatus Moraniibacteriota bacterium]
MSNPEMLNMITIEVVELTEKRKEQMRKRMIELGRELERQREFYFFPGIDPEGYAKIKATEEEYPGFTTPVDELIKRFKQDGMKIVLGDHPESGNVYALPSFSDDIENDSVPLRHLQIKSGVDGRVEELIIISKKWYGYYNKKV